MSPLPLVSSPVFPSSLSTALSWAADWWELWALIAVGLVGVRLTPVVVARSERPAGLPEDAARAVERAGVPADRVGVLRRDGRVLAYAAGLTAGHGRVFVSTGLLRELDAEGVAAVVSHEYAHLARSHVPLRLGVPCAYAVAWAVDATLFGRAGLVAGAALAVPLAYLSVRVARWTEHDADAAAARGAGDDFRDALARLAAGGHLGRTAPAGGRLRGLLAALSMHPPLAERLRRLDEDTGRSGDTRVADGPAGSAARGDD
ncbi:M48 family metalloprotease [Halobaculum gomorrense]|uniref:Zn-dependent protease with chaperone function n=1 Tax=Halobaculum gomorrense TaxID=43928 RepID=A0A1M5K8S6_9EURY|nr:M48 family metalloprotease [Halobaculum gomorrense]SHG48889.1 Zn-dependent protease with chaperone function [Halobaculum gomorrense]